MITLKFLKYQAFLVVPFFATAQITHRDLLQKNCPYSRLKQVLVSEASFKPFPKTVNEWKRILPDSVRNIFITNGEDALKGNFPSVPASITLDFTRNGNRSRYEAMAFGKRNRLWNLVLAESMEDKKRFTDAIVDGIWSICEESFWGASAHLFLQKSGKGLPDIEHPVVDLFAAETAANLAFADYFVGSELDSISPLIRRRIYYEVNRRIFVPLHSAKYSWMGNGDKNAKLNNWAPWIMSNYLTAALLLEKDAVRRTQTVWQAMQLTDQYINGVGDDGACEEGPHYWSFGHGCVLDVLDLLSSATNGHVNIFKDKIIKNMGDYIYRTHVSGNYFVDVADSHPEEQPEPVMVWRFGKAVDDSDLSSFGAWLFRTHDLSQIINQPFHRARALYDLGDLHAVTVDEENFHENAVAWLPDVQLMVERTGNGMFIAAHGGNNGESHNHNDVGDFIIYQDGDPVIIDVGSGTYTAKTFSAGRYDLWFNTSAYHNLPTIAGQQQKPGAAYTASHVSYSKQNETTILGMNIEKSYAPESGINLWRRTFSVARDHIMITDSFSSVKPITALKQSFMTICASDINSPGTITFTTVHGHKVTLQYSDEWQVSKEVVPLVTEEDQGLKQTWRGQPITRILLTHRSTPTNGSFHYVFSPKEIDGEK
jgi:Heparinase II/III-like protein